MIFSSYETNPDNSRHEYTRNEYNDYKYKRKEYTEYNWVIFLFFSANIVA